MNWAERRWDRLRRRWSRWDTVLLLGSLALLVGAALPLPGYSVGPGPTLAADELVAVAGGQPYPPAGEVLVATVALRPLTPFVALQAWLDQAVEAVPDQEVVSSEQRALDMGTSRDAAVAVARQRLQEAGPVATGVPDVEIRPSAVDGNSAGLAFTVAILDVLTPGELTGGGRVGITGTIELGGAVGPVGSVAQKAVAVRAAGADRLLVPAGQGDEAGTFVGSTLEIVEVATLDQALAALERRGGDGASLRGAEGG